MSEVLLINLSCLQHFCNFSRRIGREISEDVCLALDVLALDDVRRFRTTETVLKLMSFIVAARNSHDGRSSVPDWLGNRAMKLLEPPG